MLRDDVIKSFRIGTTMFEQVPELELGSCNGCDFHNSDIDCPEGIHCGPGNFIYVSQRHYLSLDEEEGKAVMDAIKTALFNLRYDRNQYVRVQKSQVMPLILADKDERIAKYEKLLADLEGKVNDEK